MADGGGGYTRSRYEAGYESDWNPSPPSQGRADDEIYAAGAKLRDWARYLAKNSSMIKATLDARCSKAIGTGLSYVPMVRDRQGEPIEKINDIITKIHKKWSMKVDVSGELSRQEIERLVFREWDTVGEVFARKVRRTADPSRVYQVQLIRSESIPYGFYSSGQTKMGVERSQWGEPKRYWVYPDATATQWSYEPPKQIPADQIAHLRRQSEIDQTRGVTLFHPVIFRVSDIAEFQQSHRRAARVSQNLYGSINRDIDYNPLDSASIDNESVNDRGQTELDLSDLVLLDHLKPGESVQFHEAASPNQNAVEFINQEYRQFAAACRVAFSWIAYVFDRAFAAQRTELVHAWGMILEDREHFIRDFAKPVLYDEVVKQAILLNVIPKRELRRADPDTLYDVLIDGPAMPSINPIEDRKTAEIDQINRWDSRASIARRFGKDIKHVDAEVARDNVSRGTIESESNNEDD